ncbi:MAG: hypothetical protein WCJ72_14845, partial [Chryseobacterium sp.]
MAGVFILSVLLPLPASLNILSLRLLLGGCIFITYTQFLSVILWLLKYNASFTIYPLLFFALTFITFVVSQKKPIQSFRVLKPKNTDFIIVAAALIVPVFILIGAARHGLNSQTSISFITSGMDDISHLSMVADEYRNNANLIIGPNNINLLTHAGFVAYPKGAHVSTAIIWLSVDKIRNISPDSLTVQQLINRYVITKFILLFMATLSIALCLYFSAVFLNTKEKVYKNNFNLYTAVIFGNVVVCYFFILPIFMQGFFSFLPIAIITPLVFMLTIYAVKPKSIGSDYLWLYIGLLTGSTALCWVLITPFLILGSLLALYINKENASLKKKLKSSGFVLCITGLIVASFAVLFQAIIIKKYSPGGLNTLTEKGGILPVNTTITLLMVLSTIVALLLFHRKVKHLIGIIFSLTFG